MTKLPNASAVASKAAVSTLLVSSPPRCYKNLERAAEHPDTTEDLIELLSTGSVIVQYCILTGLGVRWI